MCAGLAAYLDVDVTVVRVVFAGLAAVTFGGWVLAYLLLAVITPVAATTQEQAAAHGAPFTAQEFIRRAREGYYEGMHTWGDRRARREWKRKFRREMRGWRSAFHPRVHGTEEKDLRLR